MDQLTEQLAQTRLQDDAIHTDGCRGALEELARADRLIRELITCSENKTKGASRRARNLVQVNRFQLDLDREMPPAQDRSGKAHDRDTTTLLVASWKMNEFEYSKGTLPSLARGLFTYQDPTLPHTAAASEKDQKDKKVFVPSDETSAQDTIDTKQPYPDNGGTHRILIRGYDKFFNIGEVKTTSTEWLSSETTGPYEVTLKENGCIIFMAGLPPHLVGQEGGCVVSSKHFLGEQAPLEENVQGPAVSHSAKGREWLEKSLASKGKTLQQFGLWLWNHNLTAVAELCDDSFEEHILEYPIERSGLYLHGLNRNTAEFQTLSSDNVQAVAKEWGLRTTDYLTLDSYQEVMDFADKIRNTGEYDNRAVEGFVVRCKTKSEGSTHFFKIKYDEPYLMYREWREITKHILSVTNKAKKTSSKQADARTATVVPEEKLNLRMKYPLTKPYVEFVKGLLRTQPELFAGYNKNQGIIAIRDMFLKAWESKSTVEQDSSLKLPEVASKSSEDYQRTVIIPIATIGCGKTTVSVALSKLFGWAHVSSDDFHHFRKSAGQRFLKEIVNQLKINTVVIADRNNHESIHRERIMDEVVAAFPKTRFVAMFWSHEGLPLSRIRELEVERVRSRGSNHQSLSPEYCPEFESVIQRFLKTFEPFNPMGKPDSNFSCVIESKVGEESATFVKRIVDEFAIPVLGIGSPGNAAAPSPESIQEAVRYSMQDWKVPRVASGEAEKFYKVKHGSEMPRTQSIAAASDSGQSVATTTSPGKKAKDPKYFAIKVEPGAVLRFLEEEFEQGSDPNKQQTRHITALNDQQLWSHFQQTMKSWKEQHRIGLYQHVTLIHASALKDTSAKKAQRADQLWKKYKEETSCKAPLTSQAMSNAIVSSLLDQHTTDDGFVLVTKKSGKKGKAKTPAAVPHSSSTPASGASSEGAVPSEEDDELQATLTADYLIWTERIMILRISRAVRTKTGHPFETTQATLHVTIGTAGDHVKPFESNEILQRWTSKNKHGNDPRSKDTPAAEIFALKLDKPKVFSGYLRAMTF
ncbi:hypothetical protein BGZ70_006336 [Mortierella alpina]|uniref:tRNA ligase n=1 Tax=Mortierella alpina TaxID=64518 RepID=A0A9P6J7Y2_MORAP|nr:hypothetical protein BGZ70_006336 [Mortierella alpina]